MTFCVECGAEGPTLEGLCAKDFRRTRRLVTAPEHLDVARCAHCGKFEVDGGWVAGELDDFVLGLLEAHAVTDPQVARVQYTFVSRPEDEKNVSLTVKASCRVGDWDFVDSFHARLRVHGGVCPTCSKQRGKYFVGTVQVRAAGRDLTEDEARLANDVAARLGARRGPDEFVSRVETVRGGIDVKVSTNQFAKRLAQELAREFGGTVGSSATLQTQREGKEVYRSTYVVRVPGFQVGDILLWRGARYRVIGLGETVRLEEIATGAKPTVRARDLQNARVARG